MAHLRRLLILGVCLLAGGAALAQPLGMTAATRGTALELTFTNGGPRPLTLATHVKAGTLHYDWLTVHLTSSQGTRTLRFVETRTKSGVVRERLPAKGSLTQSIDLAWWAIRAVNGPRLEPGTYELEAVWDLAALDCGGVCPTLTATTTLTVPAPVTKRCTDASRTGLELLVRQDGPALEVGVHNVDARPHCIEAWIQAHELQSDALTLTLDAGSKTPRVLHFNDARDKSARITVELLPGATSWTRWDLQAWAARPRNGALPFPGRAVWSTVSWDATSQAEAWRGRLSAELGLRLP